MKRPRGSLWRFIWPHSLAGQLVVALLAALVLAQIIAFFIATGSFFLGQQQVLPAAIRGSSVLFVLAFAPFAVMLFWLVRIRFAKAIGKLSLRMPFAAPSLPASEMEA